MDKNLKTTIQSEITDKTKNEKEMSLKYLEWLKTKRPKWKLEYKNDVVSLYNENKQLLNSSPVEKKTGGALAASLRCLYDATSPIKQK